MDQLLAIALTSAYENIIHELGEQLHKQDSNNKTIIIIPISDYANLIYRIQTNTINYKVTHPNTGEVKIIDSPANAFSIHENSDECDLKFIF